MELSPLRLRTCSCGLSSPAWTLLASMANSWCKHLLSTLPFQWCGCTPLCLVSILMALNLHGLGMPWLTLTLSSLAPSLSYSRARCSSKTRVLWIVDRGVYGQNLVLCLILIGCYRTKFIPSFLLLPKVPSLSTQRSLSSTWGFWWCIGMYLWKKTTWKNREVFIC